MNLSDLSTTAQEWLVLLAAIAGGYFLGILLKWIFFSLLKWYNKKRENLVFQSLYRNLSKPSSFFIPLLFATLLLPLSSVFMEIAAAKINMAQLLLEILLIMAGAWMIIESVDIFSDLVRSKFQIEKEDNLEERKIITQLQFIKRMLTVVIVILAIAFILFQFDGVRELGMGLLTSAGVAGIIIGLAAQKSIANLLAGFQIAFTQPIRLDDVVIVEGEWGRVEEITLTYVVIRIWDQRRLVVPLQYFINTTFQNWTRQSSDLLGTVFLYTDYHMPVQAVRDELKRLLEKNDKWDKRVSVVQVTDATEKTMQIRALMSARNAGDAWDLRCQIREQLITFIQEKYPEALPKTRVEIPFMDHQGNGKQRAFEPSEKDEA